jgi:hypothetical protein
MIRFVDLTAAYWIDPEPGETGPFAFVDTVTDRFVTIGDDQLWFDRDDFEYACASERGIVTDERIEFHGRCRALIPAHFQ